MIIFFCISKALKGFLSFWTRRWGVKHFGAGQGRGVVVSWWVGIPLYRIIVCTHFSSNLYTFLAILRWVCMVNPFCTCGCASQVCIYPLLQLRAGYQLSSQLLKILWLSGKVHFLSSSFSVHKNSTTWRFFFFFFCAVPSYHGNMPENTGFVVKLKSMWFALFYRKCGRIGLISPFTELWFNSYYQLKHRFAISFFCVFEGYSILSHSVNMDCNCMVLYIFHVKTHHGRY